MNALYVIYIFSTNTMYYLVDKHPEWGFRRAACSYSAIKALTFWAVMAIG
jgi:hypothetical protein